MVGTARWPRVASVRWRVRPGRPLAVWVGGGRAVARPATEGGTSPEAGRPGPRPPRVSGPSLSLGHLRRRTGTVSTSGPAGGQNESGTQRASHSAGQAHVLHGGSTAVCRGPAPPRQQEGPPAFPVTIPGPGHGPQPGRADATGKRTARPRRAGRGPQGPGGKGQREDSAPSPLSAAVGWGPSCAADPKALYASLSSLKHEQRHHDLPANTRRRQGRRGRS